MTELATMEFHPRPEAGEARPWAFPAPGRGTLDNGITVLRCHRPGQQVVAVEVLLDAPLDAEPAGLDGVATIMARAFSEGTDKHSAEDFAAELERAGATLDAHADHPGVRLSLEVPASRLAKGLALLSDALRAPAFAGSEVERLVRNRLDEI
ncbi:insulinase family protein, partial [Streptomyces sp. SID625]|nr:insulinase family protein [Streptomyces sp. SID625]